MSNRKRQCIPEGIKKIIAGNQRYKCANNPNVTLEGLENYKCPMWKTDGTFDAAGYEIDHIIEVSVGGSNNIDNLQALCNSCHAAKTRKFVSGNSLWNFNNQRIRENDCTDFIAKRDINIKVNIKNYNKYDRSKYISDPEEFFKDNFIVTDNDQDVIDFNIIENLYKESYPGRINFKEIQQMAKVLNLKVKGCCIIGIKRNA